MTGARRIRGAKPLGFVFAFAFAVVGFAVAADAATVREETSEEASGVAPASDVAFDEADRLWHEGHPGASIRMLEAEIGRRPDDPEVLLALGSRLHTLGGSHRAASVLRRALDVAPDAVFAREARHWLGLAWLELHRTEEAQSLFSQAVESDRDDPLAPYGLAWVYLRDRRYDDAIAMFEEAERRGHPAAAVDLEYARAERQTSLDLGKADRRATTWLWMSLIVGAVAYGGALWRVRES